MNTDSASDAIADMLNDGEVEEVLEGEETTAEAETETDENEEEVEEPEIEQEEETEEQSIESVSELAEALGMSVEDVLTNLKHEFNAGGESQTVTLQELQTGYQKGVDYTNKTEALAAEKRQFEAATQQANAAFEQQAREGAALLNHLEQQIVGEMNSAEMERLQITDKTEWVAKRMEYQQRLDSFQQLRQGAANAYNQHTQQVTEQQQQAHIQYVAEQREALVSAIPDWNESLQGEITSYLGNQGITQEELGQISNHVHLKLAHKAMLYDKMVKEAKTVTKKVRKLPKVTNPTKARTGKQLGADGVRSLKGKLRGSGKLNDAAAVIENMM